LRDSSEEEDNESEEFDSPSLTLSISATNGRLGAAFYDKETFSLFLLEDSPLAALQPEFSSRIRKDQSESSVSDGSIPSGRLDAGETRDLAGMREFLEMFLRCRCTESGILFSDIEKSLINSSQNWFWLPPSAQRIFSQISKNNVSLEKVECMRKIHLRKSPFSLHPHPVNGTGSTLQIRPAREYSFSAGKSRLMTLRISEEVDDSTSASASMSTTRQNQAASTQRSSGVSQGFQAWRNRNANGGDETQKRIRQELGLACRLDLESCPLSTSAASALLQHMIRSRAAGDLPNSETDVEISKIETLTLDKCLFINADSRAALGVFDEESHSTFHSSQVKEGLSLFGKSKIEAEAI